jgi:hypothetical protein
MASGTIMVDAAYVKAFRDFLKVGPSFANLPNLEKEFYGDSDRAVVLLCATAVENIIENAILHVFRDHADVRALVDFDHPIGTFSAKITVAFALGIFHTQTKHDLDLIRLLRNGFAHSRMLLRFETPAVKGVCDNLLLPDTTHARSPSAYDRVEADKTKVTDMGHPKTRYLTTCHTIAAWLLEFTADERVSETKPLSLSKLP